MLCRRREKMHILRFECTVKSSPIELTWSAEMMYARHVAPNETLVLHWSARARRERGCSYRVGFYFSQIAG